jgi:transposase InsO family protein
VERAKAVIKQVCVPTQFRERVAAELHSNNMHIGFDRLYASARARFYWPGMYSFLHQYVITCLDCQRCKRPAHPNKTPIGALPIAAPLTRFTCDFHGPFPESDGMKYILIFICCTSGWVELIPTADTTARTVVQALYDNIVTRYGVPHGLALQSDCGSAFIAALTRLCCRTFGIRQQHSAPYNPQANSRAESFADILHKSLRLVCKKQSDWCKHIQSIAYSYRASPTTNILLSPFEIVFGRQMDLPIDASLGKPETLSTNADAYHSEIGAKLEVLKLIAQQNADETATRQRARANTGAKQPSYKVGDKVLLYNPVTKTGENPKLKVRYEPYLIKEVCRGYTFKLQNLSTGVDLKRAVHARRLRPLIERDNNPALITPNPIVIYENKINQLSFNVVIDNCVQTSADAVACFVDHNMLPVGEVSERILFQGGQEVVQDQLRIAQISLGTVLPATLLTSAGAIESYKSIIHVLVDKTQNSFKTPMNELLQLANESVSTMVIPFPDFFESDSQVWSVSQDCIEALLAFQSVKQVNERLSHVTIVCNSLLQSDVLKVVCEQLLKRKESLILDALDAEKDATDSPSSTWHSVKAVLKKRNHRGKVQFLVQWQEDDSKSWVNRADLTDAAVQLFLTQRGHKRKHRSKH